MAKKVLTLIKLQVPGGAANPAPPVGPALGQHGVNIMEFCKAFNAQTQDQNGRIIPVEITVFEDRSFTFITKTPPAAVLIKEAAGHRQGLGRAQPREGRHDHRRPGAPDRRDQAAGPERARPRPGLEDHRGHRALDGRGGSARCPSTASATASLYEQVDREREYSPAEAIALVKSFQSAQGSTRRWRSHIRTGLNVRHADEQLRGTLVASQRARQGHDGRRVRQGRQGARGRGRRRRRRRRRGSRQARRGGLHRLRRGHRDART